MPRRASARTQFREESPPAEPRQPKVTFDDPLIQLRTNWKWAAFSQFFYTFNRVFAMNDVSLTQIEDDLAHGSNLVLPRVMQRLLYAVSYDRKISLDNWQSALRKQYRRRLPSANPIGPEPRVEKPDLSSSPPPEVLSELDQEANHINGEAQYEEHKSMEIDDGGENKMSMPESTRASTAERGLSLEASAKAYSAQPSEVDSLQVKPSESMEQEESKNWLELPMLTKLESMHLLTEWQFQNPTRLRTLMRSDDDNATWRIEPFGYDSKKNAYWLIGGDRIWLQRVPPKPPRSKAAAVRDSTSLKRKRGGGGAASSGTSRGQAKHTNPSNKLVKPAAKRPRFEERGEPENGRSRAAKTQAKVKLDAQARELADLNRQALARSSSSSTLRTSSRSPKKILSQRPSGTRVSARLRGREEGDEWQAVPDEWLRDPSHEEKSILPLKEEKKKSAVKAVLEIDGSEISDLTELSEESADKTLDESGVNGAEELEKAEYQSVKKEEEVTPVVEDAVAPDDGAEPDSRFLPEGFIEWETVCITLEEWEHFPEQFAKATNYFERALYKTLIKDIVPTVIEHLREVERQQKLSQAITQRKRSSRLLLRQSVKEEAEAAERKKKEEEERNSRALRQEARARKEEQSREKRELAREMRRREREEQEEQERLKADQTLDGINAAEGDVRVDVVQSGTTAQPSVTSQKPQAKTRRQSRKHPSVSHLLDGKNGSKTTSGSRTPVGEDWELDCEICNRRGINLDDGTPMMSCGMCSKWQHIACHDYADQQAGRRRRNWDQVDFLCLNCRAKKTGVSRHPNPQSHAGVPQYPASHSSYTLPSIGNMLINQPYTSGHGHSIAPVNGSLTSYERGAPMSDARSSRHPHPSISPQQATTHSPHEQHQPYSGPISFSHYQPHQRGFSSTADPSFGQSSHTQAYGYAAQYPVINGSQTYQQQTSQNRLDMNNTTSQRTTAEQRMTYNVTGDAGSSHSYALHTQAISPIPWSQLHPLHSPPVISGPFAASPQQYSQYRYHNDSPFQHRAPL